MRSRRCSLSHVQTVWEVGHAGAQTVTLEDFPPGPDQPRRLAAAWQAGKAGETAARALHAQRDAESQPRDRVVVSTPALDPPAPIHRGGRTTRGFRLASVIMVVCPCVISASTYSGCGGPQRGGGRPGSPRFLAGDVPDGWWCAPCPPRRPVECLQRGPWPILAARSHPSAASEQPGSLGAGAASASDSSPAGAAAVAVDACAQSPQAASDAVAAAGS